MMCWHVNWKRYSSSWWLFGSTLAFIPIVTFVSYLLIAFALKPYHMVAAVVPDEKDPQALEKETNWQCAAHIIKFATPMSLSQACFSMISVVSIYAAGRMGITELGAASLTFSFINATSFSVAAGFCGALETLFSHSYGENPDSKKYGTYAQRMILILLLFSFPLAALFAFCRPLLLLAGQNAAISSHVALFTQFALIGLIPSMLMEVARRYYQAQHATKPIAIVTTLGSLVVNPLAIVVFYYVFDAGYTSLALAWSVLQVAMLGLLVVYAKSSGLAERTWSGWNQDSLKHWGPMLKLGFLSFIMMVSEFIVIELNNMSAGYETEVDLAAFSISVQICFFAWSIAAGLFGTMSVLAGTYIGAGRPLKTRQYAIVGTFVALGVAFFNILWMLLFGNVIAAAYSDSEEVREAFKPILWCLVLFHLGDVVQSNTLGLFRGCGMHTRGAVGVAISYALVGMPLGWFMCFYLRWGVAMLWLGPAIGSLCAGWPLYFHGIFRTDWTKLQPHVEELPAADFE